MRENVTCEGVLLTPPRRLPQIASAVNDLTTTNKKKLVKKSTPSFLMSERPKQVSLFFNPCMSSEVMDIL